MYKRQVQDDHFSEVPEQPHPTALDGLKLTYFDHPGRGEAVRLALRIAGVAFDDERVTFDEWPKLKPHTPWFTLPMLTLPDGEQLAQTQSLLRWIGTEASPRLYPTDPLTAARCDELVDVINDLEQIAKLELIPAFNETLAKVDGYIARHGAGGHAVGDTLTIADVKVFWAACFLSSGFIEAIPRGALDRYTHVQAVRATVGRLPVVRAYYAGRASDGTMPTYEQPFLDATKL